MNVADSFYELFSKLKDCNDAEQKQIIDEMNQVMDKMNKKEFNTVFTIDTFEKFFKMIEEKKLSIGNAILLLNHMRYCKAQEDTHINSFANSMFDKNFDLMIVKEEKKNEGEDEILLIDLCRSFLLLHDEHTVFFFRPACIHFLLKVALNKEESEKDQKKVEMVFLALSNICELEDLRQELYLNEIKEIIQYHQEHRNLIQLVYWSVWRFLINRFYSDITLEGVIVNDLCLGREAIGEIEELSKNVDWKKKEDEMSKETEPKELLMINRWLDSLAYFFKYSQFGCKENAELIACVVTLCRKSFDYFKEISFRSISLFDAMISESTVSISDLQQNGVFDIALKIIQQSTLNDDSMEICIDFFWRVHERLNDEMVDETGKKKLKKLKRDIYEEMEQEGCEDSIAVFYWRLSEDALFDDIGYTLYVLCVHL
ncbi:uncharacterized protein MONOS_18670 [Monocercomonoides exilis]|uniref:uncharacterized protein n=1 Tax=Monocercomonoides exilis TaxID=2049356 RepID=UPI00355976EA|nr:hypothetical protein MONOS_18670 [Monocercomonoides exilis]